MVFNITTTHVNHLGFSAIFACISLGFLFVKTVLKEEKGPGLWSISFLLNSVGFLFWSGKLAMATWKYFLIGEIAHMGGFMLLVIGVYRITGHAIKAKSAAALCAFIAVWILALVSFREHREVSVMCLRLLRTSLFLFAGICVLHQAQKGKGIGEVIASISLLIWGVYNVFYGFIATERFNDYVFGFLVGLQVLAAFGLLTMIVSRIHLKAAENERRVNQLEKLLPICAHCRRIRDRKNEWHQIESYIEQKTSSQFSHGICPDCLQRHFPEYASKIKR